MVYVDTKFREDQIVQKVKGGHPHTLMHTLSLSHTHTHTHTHTNKQYCNVINLFSSPLGRKRAKKCMDTFKTLTTFLQNIYSITNRRRVD